MQARNVPQLKILVNSSAVYTLSRKGFRHNGSLRDYSGLVNFILQVIESTQISSGFLVGNGTFTHMFALQVLGDEGRGKRLISRSLVTKRSCRAGSRAWLSQHPSLWYTTITSYQNLGLFRTYFITCGLFVHTWRT